MDFSLKNGKEEENDLVEDLTMQNTVNVLNALSREQLIELNYVIKELKEPNKMIGGRIAVFQFPPLASTVLSHRTSYIDRIFTWETFR